MKPRLGQHLPSQDLGYLQQMKSKTSNQRQVTQPKVNRAAKAWVHHNIADQQATTLYWRYKAKEANNIAHVSKKI